MLVLTRKPGESIQIGDNITIKLVMIDKNKVRIGIDAPMDVQIMRTELLTEQVKTVWGDVPIND